MKWIAGIIVFICLIIAICPSCKSNNHNRRHKYKDSFYNGDYDFDVKRMPLIKPYVSLSSSVDTSLWFCNLRTHNISYTSSANGGQFYVNKDFIAIACTKKCSFDGQLTDSVFYLLSPKDTMEFAFRTKAELTRKVDRLFGVKHIELKSFRAVYEQYHKTGKLPWLSDEE